MNTINNTAGKTTGKTTNNGPGILPRLLAGAVLLAGFAAAAASHAGNYGGNCVSYQLKAYGGEAGVRTLDNPGDFRRTGGHTSGQFCGSGRIKIELSKRDPHTHVSLWVDGYEYVFGQGDRGDRHANHWFRRYFHIDLPRYNHGYTHNNGYDDGYNNKHYKKKRRNKHKDHDYYGGQYNNSYSYEQNNYHYNHKPKAHRPKHSHGHGLVPKPRLRIGSRLHKKAHRLHLPHQHKRQHYAHH